MQLRAGEINHHDGPEAAAEYVEEQLDHYAHAPLDEGGEQ